MAEEALSHVLLFPFPAQGHVPPMLKLAELLSTSALFVTFVNTENIHRRFLRCSPAFDRLARQPRFRFCTIPDGLPEDDPRPFHKFFDLADSLRTQSREHFKELLAPKDGRGPVGWPPVTCIVADAILFLAIEVAEELDIPVMLLWTSSPCSILAYYSIPELIERGEIPFREEADMDELVQGVLGMESFLRRRDLPGGLLRRAKCITDSQLQFLMTAINNLTRARTLILNSAECLESPILSHIRSICPVTYTLAPLQNLLKNIGSCCPNQDDDRIGNRTSSNSASVWHQDRSCMPWLDSQPNNSVVYVSFGSITIVSRDTFLEFWHGLVDSGHPFLWVIRPDMVEGGTETSAMMIPQDVDTETMARTFIVAWAPQEEVLAHPAVGCFLTHCGWNSALESITAGVPMICWPFYGDQQITSRFVSHIWKVGVDMKDLGRRSDIEEMVRKVMDGEQAEELRRSAIAMSQVAQSAAHEGGSSYANFRNLVEHIKSLTLNTDQASNK